MGKRERKGTTKEQKDENMEQKSLQGSSRNPQKVEKRGPGINAEIDAESVSPALPADPPIWAWLGLAGGGPALAKASLSSGTERTI